jgi:hypothetical protein
LKEKNRQAVCVLISDEGIVIQFTKWRGSIDRLLYAVVFRLQNMAGRSTVLVDVDPASWLKERMCDELGAQGAGNL